MALSRRHKLHEVLEALAGPGVKVDFYPSTNLQLKYPGIVYTLDDIDTTHADNRPYTLINRYQVTLMSTDPEDSLIEKIAALPLTAFSRSYQSGTIIHTVFTIYF